MTLQLDIRYPGRFDAATSEFPQGSFKNRSAPAALDGSYLEKDWANDKQGFFSSLMAALGGVAANGLVDEVGASQHYDQLLAVIQSLVDASSSLETDDHLASPDDVGMLARGFTLADIDPLSNVVTGTTGNFVSYGSYPGAAAGAMAVNKITNDLFVAAGTIMYKSAGGTGAFTAIGSYPGTGITGVAVHDKDGHVYACDNSNNVYKLTDGVGSFALFGDYISLSGTLIPIDIAVDQENGDVVVVDTGLDKLVKSAGGEVDFVEMSLAQPANTNCLTIAKGSVYFVGVTGDVYRSLFGETTYNVYGSVPSVNAISNIDHDDISGSMFISIFSEAKVYKLTGNGLFTEIGAYPDTNLTGVAVSSLLGHVYASDLSTPDVYRQTGTIVTPAVDWWVKT